jgi:hypothetical protein
MYCIYEKRWSFKELAMFLPLREGISRSSVITSNSLTFSLIFALLVSTQTILKHFLENSINLSSEVSDNFVKSMAETYRLKILFKTTSRDMKLFTSSSVGSELSVYPL